MRRLLIIGIGAGDPDYVTVGAVRALNEVDVFFVLDKGEGTEDLAGFRREVCERFIERPGYRMVEAQDPPRPTDGGAPGHDAALADWHRRRIDLYERLLVDELGDGGCGGILAWGDPTLYDSTLRLVDEIVARGRVELDHQVIPGISSVSALAARHRIPLNRLGRPVHVTTGRRLAEGWPEGADTVVVMLDGRGTYLDLDDRDVEIWWGAYLGTRDELLVAGPLATAKHEIARVRAEARARKGWVFDTYLLRRPAGPAGP